ncbi:MAG TPA: hypothetical protein VM032_02540 [Vicinamibacterales bacterium]|nr:hypothetical protein [Vicinamibacterales bacterium]
MGWYLHAVSLATTALITLFPGLGYFLGAAPAAVPETIRRTVPWTAGNRAGVFELSNVTGSVHIVAEDRLDVSVVATRTIVRQGAAGDAGPSLDFRQESDRVVVCGDASRCGCHVDWPRDARRGRDDRTRVRVDFEVRVPRRASLDVCTVNGGTLKVEGSEGRYTLSNVNGDLQMVQVRGAGRASTVNGDLEASFAAPPEAAAEFKTVNGRVDVTLPASLSADLRLKTMNGGLYTDFETTPLPQQATSERRNGRFVYRADRYASVRVGQGGPELTFETLNGDIQVRKR